MEQKLKSYKSFDREAKMLLLKALKMGHFEQSDVDTLEEKGCFGKVLDPFAQMRKNHGINDDEE